jgi:hypothetical protein
MRYVLRHSKCVLTAVVIALFLRSPAFSQKNTVRDKRVDRAIVRALDFLSKQQKPSGAWEIKQFGESTAATSLAVMSFMAAGHLPGEGPYGKQLNQAIKWVVDHQQSNGQIVAQTSHGPMYSHGISTLMLAEVAGMVDSSQTKPVRRALERAVRLILQAQIVEKTQRLAGGRRYHPTSRDSDLSVTGWQLLALRAAKNIGCDVPKSHIDMAVDYVKRCRRGNGFGYQPGGAPNPTRTGTGILALEVCGAHHSTEAIAGADYLMSRPLRYGEPYFYYGVYYCTVGMFKVGGRYWERTKANTIDSLLPNQEANGSWWNKLGGERHHGPVYSTTMAVLALAVEYQYLPIYQR